MWLMAIAVIVGTVVVLKMRGANPKRAGIARAGMGGAGMNRSGINRGRVKLSPQQRGKKSNKTNSQYHAISVCSGEEPCSSAQAIKDDKFLAKDAPTLPLGTCGNADCHCHYEHHADRRDADDRRLTFGMCQELHGLNERERREARDRRKVKSSR